MLNHQISAIEALEFYNAICWAQRHATVSDDNEGAKEHCTYLEELRAHFLEIALAESSVLSPENETTFFHRKIREYVGNQNE